MLEYIETTPLSGTTHKERTALYTTPTPQEYFPPFIMEFPLLRYEDHAPLNDIVPSTLSLSSDKPCDVCPPLDVCQIQDPILKPGPTPESALLTKACTTEPNLYEQPMPGTSCDRTLLCIQATSADYLEGLHRDGNLTSVPLTSRQSNSWTCDNLDSNHLLVETAKQSDVDLNNAGCPLLECKGDHGFCLDRCEDPIEAFLSQSENNFVGYCSDFDVSYFDLLETVAEKRPIQTKTHESTKCISPPPLKPSLRSSQSGLRLRSESRSVQGSQPKFQPSASSEKVIHFPKRTRRLHSGHLPPKKYFLKQYLFAQSLLELQ